MGNSVSPSPAQVMPYEELFESAIEQVNQRLSEYLTPVAGETLLSGDHDPAKGLWEAMRYSTLDGGKRIRSVLTLETCLACGGSVEQVLPTACAIEMIHAQSLIHDDLPCMDNDELRRGKPTLHIAHGESTAVLAGDALIAMAFGLISKHTPVSEKLSPQRILDVLTEFSRATSVIGLVNGQYVDIEYEGKQYTTDILDYIHTYKTGALFKFSAFAGAKLSGVDNTVVETMTEFGSKLGLAFQIVDDVLDIQSSTETMGKTVGKDVMQEKATYPALHGVEASQQKAQQLIEDAIEQIRECARQHNLQVDSLIRLAEFINTRIS